MTHQFALTASSKMPTWARWLGFAGLIPQAVLAAVVIASPSYAGPVASGLALSYAALILSFNGGAWVIGLSPGISLSVTGATLIGALGFDYKLAAKGLCPHGWLRLRTPLSLGLGGLTLLIAIVP